MKQTQIKRVDADEQVIRSMMPASATPIDKMLARCQKIDLVGENLETACDLAKHYDVGFRSVVRYVEMGIGLAELEQALQIRDDYLERTRISVPLANRLARAVDFQPDSIRDIVDAIVEASFELGGRLPVHNLMHIIDDYFDGDILALYHSVIDNPKALAHTVRMARGSRYSALSLDVDPREEGFEEEE